SRSGSEGLKPASATIAASPALSATTAANAMRPTGGTLGTHRPRDHDALDLVGALVDLRDLRVAHHALDRVFLDVAVAAEDLDRVGRDLHRDVGAVELRHRGDLRQLLAVRALVDQLAALVEQPARGLALRLHVGQHP